MRGVGNCRVIRHRCEITRYQYDANGNLQHQYDVRNDHVEYTYDALNRKTKHIQYKASSNLVTNYTSYDEEGNLTGMTDPKGQGFTYVYDELNRRKDENYPASALTPYLTLSKVHTDYDGNNNVIGIIETKATTTNAIITDATINTYDDFDSRRSGRARETRQLQQIVHLHSPLPSPGKGLLFVLTHLRRETVELDSSGSCDNAGTGGNNGKRRSPAQQDAFASQRKAVIYNNHSSFFYVE